MFSELSKIVRQEKNIELISFLDDKDFTQADFGDTDHLTLNGAVKLTRKIRQQLNESHFSGSSINK